METSFIRLAIIAAILPLAPLLFGYFPATGDMRDVFIPLESFFREQQLQGNIPAWNGAVSFGFPVIAAAQIGFFYPVLFVLRFLPIWMELPIALIVHVSACAAGMFLFVRRLHLSKEASLFAALAFSLSQFIWQHSTHLNIFLAVAWFPWQMLAVDILFRKEKIEQRGIIALLVLFGIPFLIGQIQIPFLMMTVALVYGIHIRSIKRSLIPIVIISFATFLVAAVQLLPTLELATLSSRGTPGEFDTIRANQHSYPLYHLPTAVFPKFYGTDNTYWGKRLEIEYGSYIGVIPLVLAIFYGWRRSFFAWLAGISFFLALGSLSPFRLIGLEPSLWIFSAPARWLFFTTFSLAIFAGFGFDAIWNTVASVKRFFYRIAFVFVAFVIGGNLFLSLPAVTENTKIVSMLTSAKTSSISFKSLYTYIPLILLCALPYVVHHKNGKKIILALTALELALITVTTMPLVHWKQVLAEPSSIARLPEHIKNNSTRIYSLRDGGDTGAYFTNPSSRADAAKRELQKNLLVPMVSAQFGVYGIEWPASLDLSEQGKQLELLHPTLPYAIENKELARELTIGAVLSPTEDGEVNVTALEAKPRFEVREGSAEIISEEPSKLIIKTMSDKDTTLIVRDTFYPGWEAYVDDTKVQIEKGPLFFRSVAVPAGEHIVTMKYIPKMVYIGAGMTLITLIICAIVTSRRL